MRLCKTYDFAPQAFGLRDRPATSTSSHFHLVWCAPIKANRSRVTGGPRGKSCDWLLDQHHIEEEEGIGTCRVPSSRLELRPPVVQCACSRRSSRDLGSLWPTLPAGQLSHKDVQARKRRPKGRLSLSRLGALSFQGWGALIIPPFDSERLMLRSFCPCHEAQRRSPDHSRRSWQPAPKSDRRQSRRPGSPTRLAYHAVPC